MRSAKLLFFGTFSMHLPVIFTLTLIMLTSAGCFSGCGGGSAATVPQQPATVNVKITNSSSNEFNITSELAITEEERAQGLMYRESMGENEGMLFVFETEGTYSFWMKNTLISLDMIYINSTGTIVDINHSSEPGSLIPFTPSANAKYVLEVNSGYCVSNNIVTGNSATIPEGY